MRLGSSLLASGTATKGYKIKSRSLSNDLSRGQAKNPSHVTGSGFDARCGQLWIASQNALDQLRAFCCVHQETNPPRMIDERKSEC